MKNTDFFKKAIPYADGFELSSVFCSGVNKEYITFSRNGYRHNVMIHNFEDQITYPLFLQRIIQGIMKSMVIDIEPHYMAFHGWQYSITLCNATFTGEYFNCPDEAARNAIEYIIDHVD